MSPDPNINWRPQTRRIQDGVERSQFRETSEPVFTTSGYIYDSAAQAEASFKGETDNYIYSRYANPTVSVFEARMKAIEQAPAAIATASGMAACFAALSCCLKAGDRVVAARQLFYSCRYIIETILPRFSIDYEFVDGTNLDEWRQALQKKAAVVFLESPTNPMLEILDIQAISHLAHQAGARVIVDNVMATPLYQRPLELGADVVMYSATKHIDGQGRALAGMVLGDEEYIEELLRPFIRHTGPGLSAFNAWIMVKGIETLELRVKAQATSATTIANMLATHPAVAQVFFPYLEQNPFYKLAKAQMSGPGTVVSFRLKKDDKQAAFDVLDNLQLVSISNNFGDAKSLITHPATTTHCKLTEDEKIRQKITPGILRLSVGLEDSADLLADLDQALLSLP